MNKILAFIPARGGSKGLPKKNIKEFAGLPLIAHTINYALGSNLVDKVVVSTDDTKIAETSKKYGAGIIDRPASLSIDTSTTESAISHYLNIIEDKPQIIILLQPTSPLRPPQSLDKIIKLFQKKHYDSLLSISPTHNFFWQINNDDTVQAKYNYHNRPRRQDIKREDMRFIENGSLYIFSYDHFIKTKNRLGGKIGYIEWGEQYSIEIDTALDFIVLERIYKDLFC